MQTEIILIGVFFIINTFGAPHRNKEFIPEIYGTGTSKQNAKENPSNTYTVRQAPNEPFISVNQQSDVPIQPVLYNQPTNQQAILVASQPNQQPILIHQNPNQQTIWLTNLKPQPMLVSQPNQQSKINQPENQPIAQLVFIQEPNKQPPTRNPNEPPKQTIETPSTYKNPNVPIIFVTLPNQPQVTGNQQTDKRISPSELPSKQPTTTQQQPNQQQFLFVSSQTKPQPNQHGTSQVYQYIGADQSAQLSSIWMTAQPSQPTIALAQPPNPSASNQLDQPKTVSVGQPVYVSPGNQPVLAKVIDGNIVVIPINGLVNPVQ